jgi:hypothetical protein
MLLVHKNLLDETSAKDDAASSTATSLPYTRERPMRAIRPTILSKRAEHAYAIMATQTRQEDATQDAISLCQKRNQRNKDPNYAAGSSHDSKELSVVFLFIAS